MVLKRIIGCSICMRKDRRIISPVFYSCPMCLKLTCEDCVVKARRKAAFSKLLCPHCGFKLRQGYGGALWALVAFSAIVAWASPARGMVSALASSLWGLLNHG